MRAWMAASSRRSRSAAAQGAERGSAHEYTGVIGRPRSSRPSRQCHIVAVATALTSRPSAAARSSTRATRPSSGSASSSPVPACSIRAVSPSGVASSAHSDERSDDDPMSRTTITGP